jgi:hypothetical protein
MCDASDGSLVALSGVSIAGADDNWVLTWRAVSPTSNLTVRDASRRPSELIETQAPMIDLPSARGGFVPTLQVERLLTSRTIPLIAVDLQSTLEREGARVSLARTISEALRYADYPALSAGVLDFHVGSENAEPGGEALTQREVPFIVFTGMRASIGALVGDAGLAKAHHTQDNHRRAHVLSPNVGDIIVKQQCDDNAWLARIDQAISEGEENPAHTP